MIVLRGKIYYFRSRLPKALASQLNKKEFKRSLHTSNLTTAKSRAKKLQSLLIHLQQMSDMDEILRQLQSSGVDTENLTHIILRDVNIAGRNVGEMVIDPNEPGDLVQAKELLSLPDVHEKDQNDAHSSQNNISDTSPPITSMRLSEAITEYIAHYETLKKDDMLELIKCVLQIHFLCLVGDIEINNLTKLDVINFFEEIQKLPKNWRAIYDPAKADWLNTKTIIIMFNGGPGLSESTVKTKYKSAVKGFLDWGRSRLSAEGFPDISLTKHDITYRGAKAKGENDQRAFTQDELKIFFEGNLMQKYASEKSQLHKFWLSHIGLFTGARVREICQIDPIEDIKEINGILCFCITDINGGNPDPEVIKHLKNKGSKRNIPIHSQLLNLGFMDYVDWIHKSGYKRLFPQFSTVKGNAGAKASDWFGKELRTQMLRDDTKHGRLVGFHAFRHTFITYAHNNDIENYWELTGHDTKSIPQSTKGYIGEKDIVRLKSLIEKFNYRLEFFKPTKPS